MMNVTFLFSRLFLLSLIFVSFKIQAFDELEDKLKKITLAYSQLKNTIGKK